jgi:hypothetical protein
MMLPLTSPTPPTAERIRSACVRAGSALGQAIRVLMGCSFLNRLRARR